MAENTGTLYLNQNNEWGGAAAFRAQGVMLREDGSFSLGIVPRAERLPAELFGALEGPATMGSAPDGTIYMADPSRNRILRWDDCGGEGVPLPCIGEGSEVGQVRSPQAVLVGPRNALYVADTGNYRIQVFDLDTLQVRAIWGPLDPYAEPDPDSGLFHAPLDLAADSAGFLYMLDRVGVERRIHKLTGDGQVIDPFWATVQASQPALDHLAAAAYICTAIMPQGERLLVLTPDPAAPRIDAYELDGQYDQASSAMWAGVLAGQQPSGIAFDRGVLYIGSTANQRVLAFNADGMLIGEAHDFEGEVVGLSVDAHGRLLVRSREGSAWRLLPGEAYQPAGTLMLGPFEIGAGITDWRWLEVDGMLEGENAHIQFFTRTSQNAAAPPPPWISYPAGSAAPLWWSVDPDVIPASSTSLAPPDCWREVPRDQMAFMVLNNSQRYLWVAALLQGDGSTSPVIHQIRAEHSTESWLQYLPAIYTLEDQEHGFLRRTLSLFESLLDEQEALIDGFTARLNPYSSLSGDVPDHWLRWLGSWLDFDADPTWSEVQHRAALAGAFQAYAHRGTARGLQQLIQLHTGARVRIRDAAPDVSVWRLGESGGLMLEVEAMPGTVVEVSSLNQTVLGDDTPLSAELAVCFIVEIHAMDLRPGLLDKLHTLIEREKPAHSTYQLCVIEPDMRIGVQAQVGVDAVIGGSTLPDRAGTGTPSNIGEETALL